jgi:hypothetical protein
MSQTYARRERREKIVRLGCDTVIDILDVGANKQPGYLRLPILPQLPAGYSVVACTANFMTKTIDIMVSHPSFDIVAEGNPAPYFGEGIMEAEFVYVKLAGEHQEIQPAIVVKDD